MTPKVKSLTRFHQIVVLSVIHSAIPLEEALGSERVMKKKARELLEKLMKLKHTQLEESLMREQILLEEFRDDYFFNRENRRVINDPKS